VLGDLDLLEAEQIHHLLEDQHARDDRRRAVGMEARDRSPLLERQLRELVPDPVALGRVEPVAVHQRGVVGVEPLGDRGH